MHATGRYPTGRPARRRRAWRVFYRSAIILFALAMLPVMVDYGTERVQAQHGAGVAGEFVAASCEEIPGKNTGIACYGTFRSDDGTVTLEGVSVEGVRWSLSDEGARVPAAAFGPDADRIYEVGDTGAGAGAIGWIYTFGLILTWTLWFWVGIPLYRWVRSRRTPVRMLWPSRAVRALRVAPAAFTAVVAQAVAAFSLTHLLARFAQAEWLALFFGAHLLTAGCAVLGVRAWLARVELTPHALVDRRAWRTRHYLVGAIAQFTTGSNTHNPRVHLVDARGRHRLAIGSPLGCDPSEVCEQLEAWRSKPGEQAAVRSSPVQGEAASSRQRITATPARK